MRINNVCDIYPTERQGGPKRHWTENATKSFAVIFPPQRFTRFATPDSARTTQLIFLGPIVVRTRSNNFPIAILNGDEPFSWTMLGDGQKHTSRRYAVITATVITATARHTATGFSTHPLPCRTGGADALLLLPPSPSSPPHHHHHHRQHQASLPLQLPPPARCRRHHHQNRFQSSASVGTTAKHRNTRKPDNTGKAMTRQCSSCPALSGSNRVVVVGGAAGACWGSAGRLCFSSGAS